MNGIQRNYLFSGVMAAWSLCLVASSAIAAEPAKELVNNDTKDAMAQVTSVSQLSDVQPTDWAFQALQSLVERYGCIAGYPDGTYRGNRALTPNT